MQARALLLSVPACWDTLLLTLWAGLCKERQHGHGYLEQPRSYSQPEARAEAMGREVQPSDGRAAEVRAVAIALRFTGREIMQGRHMAGSVAAAAHRAGAAGINCPREKEPQHAQQVERKGQASHTPLNGRGEAKGKFTLQFTRAAPPQ